ncbi:hypothetical protein PAHAL_5G183100 [Panicum hallii]|uniref:WRKY domain-containing protein n=1 Tax=Panicum hallii TaxID=206008 RepID=A0A2S3HST6_9POAL|nr:probable WRKY transcription factor 57 [Panicum hallii]PAN28860.1 hypothetical protein PAHAL_5G183100 [Panicum hallii]
MHMALASCDSLPAADAACFFPAMAYHHPCDGGGLAASAFYGGASGPAAALFTGLAPPRRQPDAAFECLSKEDVSSVVPGTFGTPPPRMPVEQAVPDASGYAHLARGTAAVAGAEGSSTRTTDRIAFRVRSEEEVIGDGYKWRKYGKKSVKNSPNPRNYYRCSTEGCNVKKRVERDRDDPSYVVTMYEGVHNHVSPGTIYYATQDAASGRFFVAGMHQALD